jgi:hypothetical protein
MDHGSTHVFVYANSDEEVISDDEFKEGMWLSDSDEEAPALPRAVPIQLEKTPPAGGISPLGLGGSVTKYQHLPKDDESCDEDEGEETIKVETTGAEGGPPEEKKYVELDLKRTGKPPPAQQDRGGASGGGGTNYIKIAHSEQAPRPPPPPPGPFLHTPQATGKAASVSAPCDLPSRPPPLPKRGIIKNRIAPELSKMKRQRVKWQQQVPSTRSSTAVRGLLQRKARRADTNVLAVKFNTLTGPSCVHTGDAVVCSNPSCTAILSQLSQLSQSTGQEDRKVDSPVYRLDRTVFATKNFRLSNFFRFA